MHESPEDPQPAGAPSAAQPPPEAVPGDAAMERLSPRMIPYGVLSNLVQAVVLCGLLTGGVLFARGKFEEHAGWITAAGVGLAALLVVVALAEPALTYLTWRFAIDDELLVARYGILFRE